MMNLKSTKLVVILLFAFVQGTFALDFKSALRKLPRIMAHPATGCVLQGLDFASTEVALRNPYVREGNPLMQSRTVRISAKVGVCGVILAMGRYREHKAVEATSLGVNALYGVVVLRNFRNAR